MQLPKPIIHEVAMYYAGRELYNHYKNPRWNKEACLHAIDEACIALGWGYAESAGTFWFSNSQLNCTIEMNADTFPEGIDKEAVVIKKELGK